MTRKIHLTKEQFEHHYYDENLTYADMAKMFGCTATAIMRQGRKHGIVSRPAKPATDPMEGLVFGSLSVIRRDGKHVICQCSCGNLIKRNPYDIKRGRIKLCPICKRDFISDLNWKGHEDISGDYWGSLQRGAQKRGYDFDLTIENAWQIYLNQDQKCALSGVPIAFGRTRSDETTASLDRVDSSLGYLLNNIQWVHKTINKMKMDMPQGEFLDWCNRINTYVRI